ncbi:hypothetical protein JCM7447_05060 [Corynebacterium amycolatum]
MEVGWNVLSGLMGNKCRREGRVRAGGGLGVSWVVAEPKLALNGIHAGVVALRSRFVCPFK